MSETIKSIERKLCDAPETNKSLPKNCGRRNMLPNDGAQIACTFSYDIIEKLEDPTIYKEMFRKYGFEVVHFGIETKKKDKQGYKYYEQDRKSIGVVIYEPYFIKKTGLENNFDIIEHSDHTFAIFDKKTNTTFKINLLNKDDKERFIKAIAESFEKLKDEGVIKSKFITS